MYRLVLYYLIALIGLAVVLSATGRLHYNPVIVAGDAIYLVVICWLSNQVFSRVFTAPTNVESTHITALILALIITPLKDPHNILFLTAAAGLATASKYVLAIHKKHIFNPVAVGVVLTAFGPHQSASWWVGSSIMLPYVVVGGLLIVRKIRRGKMVVSFFAAAAASNFLTSLIANQVAVANLEKMVLHSSLFFLAFIMLTEPLTSPPTEQKQIWYGSLVGILFPPQVHLGNLYTTPELALIVGNVFAYMVSSKTKLLLTLTNKVKTGTNTIDFIFGLQRPLNYKPGQYMEWTLAHNDPDTRGNRRYFTLASSPTENNLRLGIKFSPEGSSYKKAILAMDNKTTIVAAQLAGDFVMPDDLNMKLAFIAGGIGITPYRSMIQYLIDKQQKRDITLLYSEKTVSGFAYTDIFSRANSQLGIRPIYTLTDINTVPSKWHGQKGQISVEMIKNQIPDYEQRLFYVSGPQAMVTSIKNQLLGLGLSRSQIKTDFFPGLA